MKDDLTYALTNFPGITSLISELETNSEQIIAIAPLPQSFKTLIISQIFKNNKQIFVLLPDIQTVRETKVELEILGAISSAVFIDDLTNEKIQETLTLINSLTSFILVAPYQVLNIELPGKSDLEKNTTHIETGGSSSYDEILEYLNYLNYNRDKFVDQPGVFAVRGSIIDFWSYSEKRPVRLEFDGDFLESMRHFDPENQRSSDKLEKTTIAASIELREDQPSSNIFDYLKNPLVFASEYELNNLLSKMEIISSVNTIDDLEDELKKELFEEDLDLIEETKDSQLKISNRQNLEELFKINAKWIIEDELGRYPERYNHRIINPPPVNSNFEILFSLLRDYAEKNQKIIITTENEFHSKRLFDLLSDYHTHLGDLFKEKIIQIVPLAIKTGFISKDDNLVVLTDYQIFNKPFRTKISKKENKTNRSGKELASLKKGDYVVHETFGIGQYAGLETIKIGQTEQESIKLLYAEGGIVYVNLNYFSLVKKFSANDDAKPQLSVLGSNEWKNTKKKVKKKIQEAARDLIMLYARRKSSIGYSFSADTIWQKELEASFFYEDTPDQSKVTSEIKEDMESLNPMDRLVCGDVGFGKTEVAIRAAFKAAIDGKQVALLVPTTILAEQHYNTFRDRLRQFPVQIHSLSRFRTKTQQNDTLLNIREGKADIVIGTHRLISNDVKFKDLGLLIIDEEHRFGVMAKEKLRQMKTNVDTLTLTATPIPRTLNLSLLGARDLSIIATPPPNRQPVYTKVEIFDINKIRNWILDEIRRGGQIFFVHDRVQSIDKIATYIRRHIPEVKFGIAHGQMKPALLEKEIYEFLNKNYDMLIATKIIESGIDIPNANTMIINRADRFGLAELHQLRGRVGRSDKKAYAYFLVPSLNTISKKAVRRLQAIEEYSDVGEGFSLSMRDLEIRGAGNLLGTAQSGSINEVGFDMYVKLLDEAVEELKQSEFKDLFKGLPQQEERTEPTIDSFFEIGIPKEYMPEQADRLSYYTALFSMKAVEEADDIKDEIQDKYGRLPLKVERLILAAILRYYASKSLFERIIIIKDKMTLILPKGEKEEYYRNKFMKLMQFIMENYSKNVRFVQDNETMKLVINNNYNTPEDMINYLISFCKAIINLLNESNSD